MAKLYAITVDGVPYTYAQNEDDARKLVDENVRRGTGNVEYSYSELSEEDSARVAESRSIPWPASPEVTEAAEEAAEVAEEAAEAIEEHREEIVEEIVENAEVAAESQVDAIVEVAEQSAAIAEVEASAAEHAEERDDGASEAQHAAEAEAAAEAVVETAVAIVPEDDLPPKVTHWWYKERGAHAS